MKFYSTLGEIEIIDEKCFSFKSTDNVRDYPYAKNLDETERPTSIHGISLGGVPTAVFGASRGPTCVHKHSLALLGRKNYLAVSNKVVCFEIAPFKFNWHLEIDTATCFGVYFDEQHRALLSHGELEIARFSEDGHLIWTAGGEDIFSGAFEVRTEFIQVTDFNDRVYRLNYITGECL